MIRKQTKLWTTKEGRKIRICDMSDTHLINTIKMFIRKANQIKRELPYPSFYGDMAQYYAEQEWDALMDQHPIDIAREEFPIFDSLEDDFYRRELGDIYDT
jgi:hypothetical protein|tara:strand:- start:58 stop:360 length:303 start_codon:yes stop_codon:yes gene_type:complete